MKFESFILRGLFIACFAVCALIMGAMLNSKPRGMSHPVASALLTAPTSCAMRPDGVVCPVQRG